MHKFGEVQVQCEIHPYVIHYIRVVQVAPFGVSVREIQSVLSKHCLIHNRICWERALIEIHHCKGL